LRSFCTARLGPHLPCASGRRRWLRIADSSLLPFRTQLGEFDKWSNDAASMKHLHVPPVLKPAGEETTFYQGGTGCPISGTPGTWQVAQCISSSHRSHQNDVHISIRLELFADGVFTIIIVCRCVRYAVVGIRGFWQPNWSKSIYSH
jgi:hypothetical protein